MIAYSTPAGHDVYVLSSVNPPGGDPLDVMFSRSGDAGSTWSAPVRVNDDAGNAWQWFGTMSASCRRSTIPTPRTAARPGR